MFLLLSFGYHMTTPSVSVSTFTPGKLVRRIRKTAAITEVQNFNPYGIAERHQESRPSSSNSAHIGRFKKCGNWVHSGNTWASSDVTHVYKNHLGWEFTDSGTLWNAENFAAPLPISGNLRNKSLVSALEHLKSQDFHIGNFVAEGKQTIELVRSTASSIAGGVRSFRASRPKDWATVKRIQRGGLPRYLWCKIPPAWLALQYGWKPLLADIEGACEHLFRRSRFSLPFVTVQGKASDSYVTVSDVHTGSNVRAYAKFENDVDVRTFLIYGLSNPPLAELSSLGLINPLEIVWETTRYSFVVDWLLPVGSWLSALSADAGYTFITGGQSAKTTARYGGSEVYSIPVGPDFQPQGHLGGPSFTGKRETYERTCYNSSPFPGLYVKNPISTLHMANALALLAQSFR